AAPGGICISRVVRDQIRHKLPSTFADTGEQSVKNIARPVRAYAMTAAAVASTPLVAAPASMGRARSLRRLIVPASAIVVLCIAAAAGGAWPKGTPPAASTQTPVAATAPSPAVVETRPHPRLSVVGLTFAHL